jgi:hypothetical protein
MGSRLGVRFLQPMQADDPAQLVLQHAARHAPGAGNQGPADINSPGAKPGGR